MLKKYASIKLAICSSIFMLIGLISIGNVNAQDVVVSEFANRPTPDLEFTELLVIADKTDLVGYVLRDNGETGTWQAGIKFKNVSLWKNLRSGTVIVVYHRDVPLNVIQDLNPSDGSIIIGANNTTYFENLSSTPSTSLTIGGNGDMMQILNPIGGNVHLLGFGSASYKTSNFDPISGPKLFHEKNSAATNIFVYPGLSLSDYSMPNSGNTKTIDTVFATPTFPNTKNLAPSASDLNSQYWRQIRAPQWPFPVVNGNVTQAGVTLSWNQAQDLYPADNYQGYLVMRGPKNTSEIPQDGRTYAQGDAIGGWEVVAVITGTQNTTFVDNKPLPCGDTTNYRVYAFRYTAPNIDIDSIYCSTRPFLGKGRSYNETTFGTFTAIRRAPAVPIIQALGVTEVCEGADVTLKVQNTYEDGTGYQWFKDGAPINGAIAKEYKAKQAGTYRVKINAPSGCSNESASINITVLPKPTALLTPTKEVRICSGDTVKFQAGPAGSTYTWLYNGSPVQNTTPNFSATNAGIYQVIVKDAKGCIDSSDITTIVYRSITMTFPDPKIDFGNLDGCKSSVSADNLLRNTGKDTAIITKIDVPNGFQYVSPALPIILAPNKSVTLKFAFTPIQPGESKGDAIIQTSSCNAFASLNLRGFKEQASVTQSYSSADFGIALSCTIQPRDTTIVIDNKGNADLVITNPIVTSPYSIISPATFPITIKAGSSSSLTIRYAPTGEGNYMSTVLLPYSSGSCKDTLRIAFSGEVRKPAFTVSDTPLEVSSLIGCVISRDTSFPVTNSGKTDITLNPTSTPGTTILTPLPIKLKAGETMMVNVRIEPPADGPYKGIISFLADECGLKKDFVINTTKESASYSLSKSSHQFNSLIRCDAQSMLKDSIMIKASALGISGEATISTIDITGPFTASIITGDTLSGGSKDFMITFAPTQEGIFTGKLTLTFEPCAITKTIDLSGSLSGSTFAIDQTIIAFPVTDSGVVEQKTFTFTNSGKEVVRIVSVGGFNAPFSYVSTKTIGDDIAPGETVTFTVSYSPSGNSTDSMIAILDIAGPCPKQLAVSISGIGNLPKPTDVNGIAELIGDSQSAKPGEMVIFPIRITSQNLAEMNLGSMSFDIAYNRSLLLAKKLTLKQSQLTGTMRESTPGILTFTITANDTNSKILAGNLIEFECMALLGDAMITPLTIQNQTFTKRTPGTCTLTTNTPTFTLEDICDLPNRLIRPTGGLSLAKIKQGLTIEVFSQDRTTLDLYALDGSLISRLTDGSLSTGKHDFALPGNLPSGVYVAMLKSGHHIRTLPFDHVK